jgi:hypothetical protein
MVYLATKNIETKRTSRKLDYKFTDNEPEEIEGSEAYKVKVIRDTGIENGKREYPIKWKNYLENENKWEPPKHLVNAQRLLKNFHRHRKKDR